MLDSGKLLNVPIHARTMKAMRKSLITGLILMGLAGTAMVSTSIAQTPPPGLNPPPPPPPVGLNPPPPPAHPQAAPEIDAASAAAALALLAGGLIVLRGRKRES
jgi:hypothetical protein